MHYYFPKSFSVENEKKLRDSASESFVIENFLTDKEFELIKKIFDKGINWNEVGEISKYHGFSWNTEYGPILNWLKPKIDKILPNWDLDFLAFQEAILPWKIHADLRWHENKIPYKMLLLPIDVVSNTSEENSNQWLDTYTITFKQRNFLKNYKNSELEGDYGNKGNDNWVRPKDDPGVENLSKEYHVTLDQWQRYFTHIPYDHFDGLEVDKFLHWKPKSLLAWDNSALHCADDFKSHNILTKKCLLVCTILKD